jgi:hypothetical protein
MGVAHERRSRYGESVADERPVWRRRFDSLESNVSPRLAELMGSEPFKIAVGLATQTRKALRTRTERTMRRALHMWNLPAGSDVTRILNELGRLQREVRELSKRVDQPAKTQGKRGSNGSTGRRPGSAGTRSRGS